MHELEKKIKYKFINQSLLRDAITHKSHEPSTFQNLEFLGDRVIALIVSSMLINNNKFIEIKELAQNFAMLVSAEFLIDIANNWNVKKYLKHKIENISNKVLVDCVEAIIGAVYIDCGYDKTYKIFHALWQQFLEKKFKEPKMMLQEFAQKKGLGTPIYQYEQCQENNIITYEACVKIETIGVAYAKGKSKHEASKLAAKKLLEKVK